MWKLIRVIEFPITKVNVVTCTGTDIGLRQKLGDVVDVAGVSEEGMLMDFSDISAILTREVHDVVDHAFVVYSGDSDAIKALDLMGDGHRTVIVDFIPTAENLAKWAFEKLSHT